MHIHGISTSRILFTGLVATFEKDITDLEKVQNDKGDPTLSL